MRKTERERRAELRSDIWYAVNTENKIITTASSYKEMRVKITHICVDKRQVPNFLYISRKYYTYEIGKDSNKQYGNLFHIGTKYSLADLDIDVDDLIRAKESA